MDKKTADEHWNDAIRYSRYSANVALVGAVFFAIVFVALVVAWIAGWI